MKNDSKKQDQETKLKEVLNKPNAEEKLKKAIKEKVKGLNTPFNK